MSFSLDHEGALLNERHTRGAGGLVVWYLADLQRADGVVGEGFPIHQFDLDSAVPLFLVLSGRPIALAFVLSKDQIPRLHNTHFNQQNWKSEKIGGPGIGP